MLGVAVVSMAAWAGAQADPVWGGTLRVGWQYDPPHLDTHLSGHTAIVWPAIHIYESLLAFNDNLEPVPHLVTDYDVSSDQTTYTFNLRQGVLFHNGKELTAEDVVASMLRWKEYTIQGRSAANMVENVEEVDRYTVRVSLHSPSAVFLVSQAQEQTAAAIMPREIVEAAGSDPVQPIGTGPFKLADFSPGRQIRLERFEDYVARDEPGSYQSGSRTAYVDAVVFIPAADEASRTIGLETGDFDVALWVSPVDFERLEAHPDVVVLTSAPFELGFNFNMREGIFANNRQLREAVLVAINPEEVLLGSIGNPRLYDMMASPMARGTPFFTERGAVEAGWGAGDPERARQLAAEAGYNGETIRWITRAGDIYQFTAQVATQQLTDAGFNIELQLIDNTTLLTWRDEPHRYELVGMATSFRPHPLFLNIVNPNTFGWFDTPTLRELTDELMAAANQEVAIEVWGQIMDEYWRELPTVIYGHRLDLHGHRTTVHNVTDQPYTVFYNVWKE